MRSARFFVANHNNVYIRMFGVDIDTEVTLDAMRRSLEDGSRMFVNTIDLVTCGIFKRTRYLINFCKKEEKNSEEKYVHSLSKGDIDAIRDWSSKRNGIWKHLSNQHYVSFQGVWNYTERRARKADIDSDILKRILNPRFFVSNMYDFFSNLVDLEYLGDTNLCVDHKLMEEDLCEEEEIKTCPDPVDQHRSHMVSSLERDQLVSRLIFKVRPPVSFHHHIDPNTVPDYVCLNFSMYEVPSVYQTMKIVHFKMLLCIL